MMRKKDGFVTIEFILVSTSLFFLLFAFVGIFTYTYPTHAIQREVDVLTRQTQRNGGVTNEDLASFKDRLNDMRFIRESDVSVEVYATTRNNNYNVVGVTESNYVSKQDNEVIELTIITPSYNQALRVITSNHKDYYVFKASVSSEKY